MIYDWWSICFNILEETELRAGPMSIVVLLSDDVFGGQFHDYIIKELKRRNKLSKETAVLNITHLFRGTKIEYLQVKWSYHTFYNTRSIEKLNMRGRIF